MPTLPMTDSSLLVRTDFSSDAAWVQVCDEAQREYGDGFRAHLVPVSDPAFDGAAWRAVRDAVPFSDEGASVLFIADRTALILPDHPVLVVDLDEGRPPFRCVPPELWGIEANLNISNMDWEDFADSVDDGGVFRGFGPLSSGADQGGRRARRPGLAHVAADPPAIS
jgi:Domain of unknown function (DUF6924)